MKKNWTLFDLFLIYICFFLLLTISIFTYLSVKKDMEKTVSTFNEPYIGELNVDIAPVDVVNIPEIVFVDIVKTKTVVKTINKKIKYVPTHLKFKVECDGKGDCYPMEYKRGKWVRY